MTARALLALVLLFAPLGIHADAAPSAPANLPIYMEGSHAGSFFYFAATLDLDQPHALVLIDAHSDASPVPVSDRIRDGLRQVRSKRERHAKIDAWRRDGTVQAFNWIEPLMPLPFTEVWWIAPDDPGPGDLDEARDQLDSRLEFESRHCGPLGRHFHQVTLSAFGANLPENLPVVVSIDLDYFATTPAENVAERFSSLWSKILTLQNLRAVTFCVSRPWLHDDSQAFALCERALTAALSLRNATVRFEPFAVQGPDQSEKAKEYYEKGTAPPRFDISGAPPSLQSLLLANAERLQVLFEHARWQKLLGQWRAESGAWRIVVDDDAQPSTDEIWRLRSPMPLRVQSEPRQPVPRQVRWLALRPEQNVYNVLPNVPSSKLFAHTAPPLVRDVESKLGMTEDGALPAEAWAPLLDDRTGWGSVRLVAEVIGESGLWQRTPEIELRVFTGHGFRAGLSEQFNLPYVFGAGFLKQRGETGPETLAGNDCANFLVYAWRRSGHRLPWCDPLQLRSHLEFLSADLDVQSLPPISAAAIQNGLVVICGKHVAAIWEDHAPLGVLNDGDIVAHHLSGQPELITLAELLRARPSPRYDLYRMPEAKPAVRLVAGGDVALHGLDPDPGRENPLSCFPSFVRSADIAVANLECALTRSTNPVSKKPFLFRNSPTAAGWLHETGLDGLSLANNHVGDYGIIGYHDTIEALEHASLGHFDHQSPWVASTGVGPLAFFGINFIENDEIEKQLSVLAEQMTKAAAGGSRIIVLPHWGREYTDQTTADQRRWARWLVDRGADIVIGSHSHRCQPLDFYRGRPIYYSLGNAFFPGSDGPVGFQQPHWARIGFDKHGRVTAKLVDSRLPAP